MAKRQVRNQLIVGYVTAVVVVGFLGFYIFDQVSPFVPVLDKVLSSGVPLTPDQTIALRHGLANTVKASSTFLFLGILFMSGLLITIMFSISSALKSINAGINRIANGDLNYRIRLRRKDEFGEIAGFFNT